MYICLGKYHFKLLVTFSPIFVAETKITFGYDFVAPLMLVCSSAPVNVSIFKQLNVRETCIRKSYGNGINSK